MAKNAKRSLVEIEAEIDRLRREAEELRAQEVAEVVEKIRSAIAAYGLTAADLGLASPRRRAGKAPARGAGAKAGRRGAAGGRARPPKYADGQGNTWVGQGKRPAWFVAALAAGRTPEELLVKGAG